jgi:hypothetical protein
MTPPACGIHRADQARQRHIVDVALEPEHAALREPQLNPCWPMAFAPLWIADSPSCNAYQMRRTGAT